MPTLHPRQPSRAPPAASRVAAAPVAPAMPVAPAAPVGRSALTPDDWIAAATEVLVDQGIDHVRVDLLARELGVTRGSFYWHFRDREDLLRRVLQAWSERSTVSLTQRLVLAQSADPQAQLRDVITLPFRGRAAAKAARIELAIRAWARRDEMARRAVDESDAARLAYHGEIFVALGFQGAQAQARAFLLYGYEVAESLLHRQGSLAQRDARRRFVEQLVSQPLKP
jgi:AcrR family transcriptional regulator